LVILVKQLIEFGRGGGWVDRVEVLIICDIHQLLFKMGRQRRHKMYFSSLLFGCVVTSSSNLFSLYATCLFLHAQEIKILIKYTSVQAWSKIFVKAFLQNMF
jgi:hypothetical protein